MDIEELIEQAQIAKSKSYSPYSKFKVGTALLTKTGIVIPGCNIENTSFSTTICAERCAIFKAVSEGHTEFEKLVMVTDAEKLTTPCGSCLQVLNEFCNEDFQIILANNTTHKQYSFKDLLPLPFNL
ncbi:MAG: Cytidine deaminase [Candidatus Heimdallarchaeota archaeon LC_3]|nr:MAG: Cytidine deaminase [Candidatus Heimdallarchaeota archaeon LC_3]